MSDSIHNPPVGGVGGNDWGDGLSDHDHRVRSITAWWGDESGDPRWTVLKGLRLEYDDAVRNAGHQEDYLNRERFVFDDDENIEHMTIRGAINDPPGRCDSLEFQTTKGRPFFAGGPGGGSVDQITGSGVLYGFDGAADGDIDRLGAIFSA